jgi:hypothetical protein
MTPPDSDTKNVSKLVYGSGANGFARQEFKYNFFLGKSANGKVFEYQLSPEWVEYVFNLVFTQLCRRFPGCWFHVPIGSAVIEAEPPETLFTRSSVKYRQKENDYCLPYAVASCLHYMKHFDAAVSISREAASLCCMPGDTAISALRRCMILHLPSEGQPMVYNHKSRHSHKRVLLSCEEITADRTPYLTLISPIGRDGSSDHAVCVVDDLIFDARLPRALKLCKESFDLVCGAKGMSELGLVMRFCLPHGKNKRKVGRQMERNW